MKKKFTFLIMSLTLLTFFALPKGMCGQQTATLVSGSGTSGYTVPDGWTTSGTVEGGNYLKFDNGTMTSPEFAPHNGLSFTYSVATFGSGTDHPLTIRILNASTNAVISEMTTATPTSSTYINTGSPLSLGDVAVAFKIQMYAPTGKGIRLRNYSVTGTPAGGQQLTPSDLALVDAPVELEFDLYDNANAQTISYTTSSTGAVTVSQSNYITATVNNNNTITVTPVAVTNGPQTITINQAADETYAAGSVTFTVDIEDSTPSSGTDVTFTCGTDNSETLTLSKEGVSMTMTSGTWSRDDNYRLYANNSLTINTSNGKITKVVFTISQNNFSGEGYNSGTKTWTGNAASLTLAASGGQVRFTPVVVTVERTPSIAVDPESLSFTYVSGGSAASQTLNVTGSNLTHDITVTLGGDNSDKFAIKKDGTDWGQNLTIPQTTASGDIQVRLNPGITQTGTYNGTITLSTDGVEDDVVVNLIGTVTNQTYTITTNVTPDYSGTVTGGGTYEGNTPVTLTAAANTGYTFSKWQDNNTDNPRNITVTQNAAYTATFTQNSYTIAVAQPTNGTVAVTGNPSTAHFGDAISFTATPDEGYRVKSSTVTQTGGEGSVEVTLDNGTYSFSMPAYNVTITVEFDVQPAVYNGEGTFTKVTTTAGLEDGGYYVLVYDNHALKASYYGNTSNEMASASVSPNNNQLINPATNIVWKLEASSTNWNLFNESISKYCCITANSTTAFSLVEETASASYLVSVANEEFTFATTATGSRCISYYSSNSSFRSYASNNAGSKLTLYKLGTPSGDPYITANPVNINYNDESGSISFTVYNEVEGGVVSAEVTDGDWLELGTVGDNVPFTCSSNDGPERTATVTLTYTYNNNETTTFEVTVTQGAPVVTYTLANSIENGRHYIIFASTDIVKKAAGAQNGDVRNAEGVTYESESGSVSVSSGNVYEFVINGPDANGYYTIYDPRTDGFMTAGDKVFKAQSTPVKWNIVFNAGNATISPATGDYTAYCIKYNAQSPRFTCYNSNQTAISLYVKDEETPQYDFYQYIAGYGNNNSVTTGWNFISLPVTGSFTPDATMTSNTYDLYQLNNIQWENYKDGDGNNASSGFNLVNGSGYLYANSANVTLHFSGAINTFTTDNGANVKNLTKGWNLIGNPYNIPIYINKPYYKMNSDGSAIETEDGITSEAIPACTGVVINAGENETVTFSQEAPVGSANNGNVQIALAQNVTTRGESSSQTLDNAIISFNEGSQLGKFYFGTQDANLYIPMDNEEYAIVSSSTQGEMPVNFKAHRDGQYTITVNPQEVEMGYLHLIDNIGGMDIDLLATPSYTFNAKADDYESRFRLVFSANMVNADLKDDFAFFSNGLLVIANEGESILQVIDVNGRIVATESVNGTCSKAINVKAGVYVLRLINGENVKTQKIIVK